MGTAIKRPYIQFIGNSSTEVTGSCHKVKFKDTTLLLDCGLIQGGDIVTTYKANREQVKRIKPKEVNAIILSHLNLDHCGLIPYVVSHNADSKVYVPTGSTKFLVLLWEDTQKIMESDALKIARKYNIKATALYSKEDIALAVDRCIEIDYNRPVNLTEDIILTYYPAGHIIHSAQILLELKEGAVIKRIGYTGDIGGLSPQPFTEPRETLPFVNVMIGECTYASPSRKNSKKDRPKDIEKILSVVENYNKILIPCFSLQRSQQLIKLLVENGVADKLPIYVDSPLCERFCGLWDDVEGWGSAVGRVQFIGSYTQSQELQREDKHCIIISASGFLTGGRIMEHLKSALPNPNNALLFVGFAGDNGLAYDIKQGDKKTVEVDGIQVKNKAAIVELRSFSSHANYEELMEYYQSCRYDKLCLVHSNQIDKVEFAKTLKDKLVEQGVASKVLAVNKEDKIYF